MSALVTSTIVRDAEIPTWFGIGGRADALATPESAEALRELLVDFPDGPVRVLGDGANLLVDDDGVGGLVVSLERLNHVDAIATGRGHLRVGAGVNLPRLITETVRDGLAGLEGLAGIPASIGGAVRMNAGGAFGEIGRVARVVEALTLRGEHVRLERPQLNFSYRSSGLERLIITHVELGLTPVEASKQPALRQRLKDVMAYKKHSQPMSADSAGCIFKNPLVEGARTSAGKLIDETGCKGWRVGGAEVSSVHANFIVTSEGCTARDVIDLMGRVRERVARERGIELEPEVVIWKRDRS